MCSDDPVWLVEPSGKDCTAKRVVYEDAEQVVVACWYPQMGGYVGKCLVDIFKSGNNECFEAYVWHNGEYPFSEDETGIIPAHIHHCMAEQFVEFGNMILEKQARWQQEDESVQ